MNLNYALSHWEWNSFFKDIDCLIIGGGIVGLSAAIHLKIASPNLSVLLLDRGSLPIGASTRNAGFACFGSLSELIDDLKHSSRDDILSLVEQRFRGLQLLRQRYGDTAIGYEALGGFEVFRERDTAIFENCQEQMDNFNKDLRPITKQETYAIVDKKISTNGLQGVAHLILNRAEGQLDTGKLMRTLLDKAQSIGIRWIGGIEINQLWESNHGVHLQTSNNWELNAQKVLIATNGFARQLLPDLDVQPARNHILITEAIEHLQLRGSFHYDKGYVYFRNVGNRILLGGGRNLDFKGEKTASFGEQKNIRKYLEQILQTVILPDQSVKIDRWWSGIMGVGKHKSPIVKMVGNNTLAAVRLGGMGVALGTEVGIEAADLLMG